MDIQYQMIPATFVEKKKKPLFCPSNFLGGHIFQLTINIRTYFWTLNSVLLIFMSIFKPILRCLDNCSLTNFESVK